MNITHSLRWNDRGLTGLPSPASTCTPIHVNFSVPDKGPDLHEYVLVRGWGEGVWVWSDRDGGAWEWWSMLGRREGGKGCVGDVGKVELAEGRCGKG